MTLDEAKDFIIFCRENGVYQVKFQELEAMIAEPERKVERFPQEDSFNYIPQMSPSIVTNCFDIPEIQS